MKTIEHITCVGPIMEDGKWTEEDLNAYVADAAINSEDPVWVYGWQEEFEVTGHDGEPERNRRYYTLVVIPNAGKVENFFLVEEVFNFCETCGDDH